MCERLASGGDIWNNLSLAEGRFFGESWFNLNPYLIICMDIEQYSRNQI